MPDDPLDDEEPLILPNSSTVPLKETVRTLPSESVCVPEPLKFGPDWFEIVCTTTPVIVASGNRGGLPGAPVPQLKILANNQFHTIL